MVESIQNSGLTIDKAEVVKLAYEAKFKDAVSLKKVKFVMKSILNMSYCKIIR